MYYKFWGKTEEKEYHLLAYHGLDACSVAQEWLDCHRPLARSLADNAKLPYDTLRGVLLFFTALHDVGKFSITFQNLCPDLLRELQNRESKKKPDIRHDQLGWMLWDRVLCDHLMGHLQKRLSLANNENTRIKGLLDVFARIAFGHHGLPPKPDASQSDSCFCESDRDSAKAYMDDLLPMFLPEESLSAIVLWAGLPKQQRRPALAHLKTRSWQLAGVIVLSDWIASGELFSFHDKRQPLAEYFAECQRTARRAFESVGLYSAAPPSSAGFGYLFPSYADRPTPLQNFCDTVKLTDGPQLWVLEDVTGSGKTEAACTLVSRMMKEGLVAGAFVGLPTMATSNAMYERMADVYHLFFSSDSRPSLVLSHGARHLSKAFRQSYSSIKSEANRDDSEDSSASCSAWLADSTKKSLLADVGIGTLDQVLLGALRVRYQSLRALGMSSKVLVADEIHAYDRYMLRVFEKIVTHHARMGVPVILLSATLPHAILKQLCRAFYRGLGSESGTPSIPAIPRSEHFPLVTRVDEGGVHQSEVQPREESVRAVPVTFLESREDVPQRILAAQKSGQCVCWIRNTIKDIVEGYEALKGALPDESLTVFHSRFTLADRLDIEQRVTRTYGKDSTGEERSGQVLIASQVVEQSLDLDFDVLISDLAPIDLMIQRAGRLHRHLRDAAGNRVRRLAEATRESPVFYVHAPPEPNIPSARWFSDYFHSANFVYPDTAQLWRTKEVLKKEERIVLPERARDLVEAVYGEEPLEVPEVFFDAENEVWGKGAASRDLADFNTINFEKGYARDDCWDDGERVPTREGDEQRAVYLARFQDGKLLPYELREYGWDLSSSKMRANAIVGEISYRAEIADAVVLLRQKRWIDNNALFLVVENEEMAWTIEDPSASKLATIQYHPVLGLQTTYTEQ